MDYSGGYLVHLLDQSIDMLLAIAKITTFDEMLELACPETSSGVRELERPQEVANLLEVWSNSEDLVNDVLNANDAVFSQVLLNDGIVGESNSLLVDLAISSLVDQFTN